MVKVKICGLTRAVDVEKAVEFGADALGFVFEPSSPRYILNFDDWEKVISQAPPFSATVGVYSRYRTRQDPCALVQALDFRDGEKISVYTFNPVHPRGYDQDQRPAIAGFRFPDHQPSESAILDIRDALEMGHTAYRAIMVDGYSPSEFGGSGIKANWHLAATLRKQSPLPFILAGGLTPDNVASAVEAVQPYAVDVSSGIEISPGIKDHIKMRDFIQAAKGI